MNTAQQTKNLNGNPLIIYIYLVVLYIVYIIWSWRFKQRHSGWFDVKRSIVQEPTCCIFFTVVLNGTGGVAEGRVYLLLRTASEVLLRL